MSSGAVKRLNMMVVSLFAAACPLSGHVLATENPVAGRKGLVRVVGHSLADDDGEFLGLGASYFTALWRCKNDPDRLRNDLAVLASNGFNYIRILSMVGYHPAWKGLEIAPVGFTNKEETSVAGWGDYWQQLPNLIDLAYDRFGLRTQITIFADAQLMPQKESRIEHMRRILTEVIPGREHKIILLEVANEAWQNGFAGDDGVADLREFAKFLNERTEIPVAITSNHDWPEIGGDAGFYQIYRGAGADIATWHFSRDRRPDDGWKPVYDCWELGEREGFPPVSSNEPIGPGSSVNSEKNPLRLAMASAFAYVAKLPMYIYHCEAGVFGMSTFDGTPGLESYRQILRLLPPDLANWRRNDGLSEDAPFTVFAKGNPNRYATQVEEGARGCVRNTGSRKGDQFVCVPIGILDQGLEVEARVALRFKAYDPLTGSEQMSATLAAGDRRVLPQGSGALIIIGQILKPAKDVDADH